MGGSNVQRSLEGKLAIITGASRGIGAAIDHNLATKGCSMVLNYTSDSSTITTQSLASTLSSTHNIQALPVQADMGDPHVPAHIINVAKNHFSHPKTHAFRIDILINNAGVGGNAELGDITPEAFHKCYTINVLGPLLLVQAALPFLPNDRSGRIVNLSSVSSAIGATGQSVYAGSKAALEGMTRVWSRELAERATVNAVNPGPVATQMYHGTTEAFKEKMKPWILNAPLQRAREGIDDQEIVEKAKRGGGRSAYGHEIAGVVGMLCSEESGWCTGSVVCANGGLVFSS